MRLQKDEEIKTLHQNMEKMRSEYELHIDELKVTLNKYQQQLLALEAKVVELDTRLAQKEDVEEQLATWKAHHDSMDKSKKEL